MTTNTHIVAPRALQALDDHEPMISPASLRELVPLTDDAADLVRRARRSIREVLDGTDDRLLVIVGPCSIHDHDSALDYADHLAALARQLSDDLVVVMRAYFEKARTAAGWPGLSTVPALDGTPDPMHGFRLARSIMAKIAQRGLPVGTEWLHLLSPSYFGDLTAWGCIGARTVEGQTHRQLASGLTMPVGMKNRTDGCVQSAVNAVMVAEQGHAIIDIDPHGRVTIRRTTGNRHCHLVLRGGADGPNYHPAAVKEARRLLRSASLPERVVIDASHGNSGKDHNRQAAVARDLAQQIADGDEAIRGVMLESFLLPGRQQPAPGRALVHGQSVTDSCLSWPATAEILAELSQASAARRRAPGGQVSRRVRTEAVSITDSPAERAVGLVDTGLFDTYMVYERNGIWTVAGGVQATVALDATRVHRDEQSWDWKSRPLRALGDALAGLPMPRWTAYGWIAFEAGQPGQSGELARLIVPQVEVRISTDTALITCADSHIRHAVRRALAADLPARPTGSVTVDLSTDRDWYCDAVTAAVQEIRSGGLQKVILSRRVPLASTVDISSTYLRGRAANTPARSFLIKMGGITAAGFCPETVLEAGADRIVSTQPLAGTRALGADAQENLRLRQELLSDPKELVEHTLSVQVACEELRRVCILDSVAAHELLSVKERGTVQHLASRVSGRLSGDHNAWDALEAVYPGVTASGIPKVAARDYIVRTEPTPRGLYAGAVLTASSDGTLDAGLALRTIFEKDGHQWLRAGAGIIAESRPEREYEETCEKLRSVAPHLVPADQP
ncbi:salicylate synthase/phospho-2-dehydro-3-deoxyheptonate aldolase [Kibdelosporangium banguiense]|uniref:3-deoxy-7-phosphoheptulonate synthase n=1 Tax=Kibdelosporangium banguiense TaxID=1365924 RepID=A0ABS4TRQ7_9PSEU|nr:salicylate synthase [Kibdelosporangium banguiense]MBP2327087.1 salicylate synthase/phospho-2-dehydro-3-deoxyheptonate aldolase [Kibdelosporangium banguiense]